MQITRCNDLDIPNFSKVRYKETGNILEIMYNARKSQGGFVRKLDKNTYIDLQTGELKEFNHIENRSQDLDNVRKSMSRGRDIINTNVVNVANCRWLTLTYADNMTNPVKLKKDYENFVARARKQFGNFEYIVCAEPQSRGAWHLHCILIFETKAPYMANNVVANCWKQGFVTVKKIDNVDNVGAYLTAYMCDVEYEEFIKEHPKINISGCIKEVDMDIDGQTVKKKYVKGARIYMYPPGFHIFRYSKGIKKPKIETLTYQKAKEKVGSAKPTFTSSMLLNDKDTGFCNTLIKEYYNKIKK